MFLLLEKPITLAIGFLSKTHAPQSSQQDHFSIKPDDSTLQIYLGFLVTQFVLIGLRNWYVQHQSSGMVVLAFTVAEFSLAIYQNVYGSDVAYIRATDVNTVYEVLILILIAVVLVKLMRSCSKALNFVAYRRILSFLKPQPTAAKTCAKHGFPIETCGKTDASIDKWEAAASSTDGGDSLFSSSEGTSSSSAIYTSVQNKGTVMDEATWASRWKNHGSDWSDSSLSDRGTPMLDIGTNAVPSRPPSSRPLADMSFLTDHQEIASEIKSQTGSKTSRFMFGTIAKRKKSGSPFWTKGARNSLDRKKTLL